MIDLHMHTNYSDGTDNVIELLRKAQMANLEIISITDHDKVDAYMELRNIDVKKYYSGVIIKGIELKSVYKGVAIEILGYGINPKRIKESKHIVIQVMDAMQEKQLEDMKKIGREIGLKFDENIHISKYSIFASNTFGLEIFKYEENKELIEKYNLGTNSNNFYRYAQSNPESIFYIDETKQIPSADIIINEIHEAGGLAFLAHPFEYPYHNKLETIEEFVKDNPNVDGLECYYSTFSEEQINGLLEICKKYNLYYSGGSDYHGKTKPDIEIGVGRGNLNISKDSINDWINKVILN